MIKRIDTQIRNGGSFVILIAHPTGTLSVTCIQFRLGFFEEKILNVIEQIKNLPVAERELAFRNGKSFSSDDVVAMLSLWKVTFLVLDQVLSISFTDLNKLERLLQRKPTARKDPA